MLHSIHIGDVTMSDNKVRIIKAIYECFNARDIDGVLAALADDVAWANGMDGGHVHGHDGVREYWTRQWAMVNPHVAPVAFRQVDEVISVEVIQTVFDLNGQPLSGQTHGLKDKTVTHIFRMDGDKITRFDIGEA
ncbi:MAG: nuclear transport factor 2 family protein [Cellvibrio sp.]|uniref:nuclear transport factor 2 family protein n=1 Tax=Cellvibrio sp. TaxID=1965322 RepID=UPI0031B0A62E